MTGNARLSVVYGEGDRHPDAATIDRAVAVLWQVWRLMLGLVVLLSLAWPPVSARLSRQRPEDPCAAPLP